jgi:Tfp pilus assembly protein PilP
MRSAITLGLGIMIAAAAPGLLAQAKPAAPAGAKLALSAAGAGAQQPAKPAAKPAAKPPAKTRAKAPVRPPVKKVEKPAASGTAAPAESEVRQARRDPFESLFNRQQKQSQAAPAIAGKPGLVIGTLRLDGIVRAPNGMIAVVSNPQARTYFLREGDHLYDGTVEKISMDGVSFHEEGKDAFGKPMERQVNKRIYPSAGEQQ